MTREEAREILQEQIDKYGKVSSAEGIKALRFAIEALEQEPCEDAISRQAVLEQINCWIDGREYEYTNATYYLIKRMQSLSSVTPQPKIGHWVTNSDFPDRLICSCCNAKFDMWVWEQKNMRYCSNCGAKMEVKADEINY